MKIEVWKSYRITDRLNCIRHGRNATYEPGLKVLANEDILFSTQMFPRLPARATFVADTNFVSGTQKMFPILFRNILCPQQMYPNLRAQARKHHEQQCVRNSVSSFASTLSSTYFGESEPQWVIFRIFFPNLTLSVHV